MLEQLPAIDLERFVRRAAFAGLAFGILVSLLTGFSVASSLALSAVWWTGAWAYLTIRRDVLSVEEDRRPPGA